MHMDEMMMAFTTDQVSRLTGLSDRQLRYWDKTGFFAPQYVDDADPRPFNRIYSFRDLVGLRTIALLVKKGVPIRELRKVGEWFHDAYDAPWSTLTFYVSGNRVYFDDPAFGGRVAGSPLGQGVIQIYPMERIAAETRQEADHLRERSIEQIGHVAQKRTVAHNQPVLAGTRIPTSAVWEFHEDGYDTDAIIQQYPRLTPEDVQAAIAFEEEHRRTHVKRAG